MLKRLREKLRTFAPALHAYRMVKIVWLEPLNRGQRLSRLSGYLHWYFKAQPSGHAVVTRLENGMRTQVMPDSDSGVSQLFTRNVDYYDDKFIRSVLRPGDFIVDAGSNVGNRTLALADVLGGALLLDANPLCLQRMVTNFRLNRLPLDKYIRVAKAVGAEPGTLTFSDFGGTHCSNQVVEAGRAEGPVVEVPVTTIDAELEKLGNPPCRYIKFDLEGHDLEGLKGAEKTLRRGDVELVKFERWQSRPLQGFLDFFAELGWEVFALDDRGEVSFDAKLLERRSNLFARRGAGRGVRDAG